VNSRATLTSRGLCAVAAAFVLGAVGLWVLHRETRVHYRLPARAAIAAARTNRGDREFLAHNPTTRVRVIPLDSKLQRVTFFDGPQVVLDAAVGEHGEVVSTEEHVAGAPASGAALANSPWVLALFSCLFLLATLVLPLRRVRNLDALVLASLTVTVPLINARLAGVSVVCAYLALGYLTLRCLVVGLRAADPDARTRTADPDVDPRGGGCADGQRAEGPAGAALSTPLLNWLCAGSEPRRRVALLRLIVAATVLAFAMITLTSSGYTDVAAASMQGATELLHGVLPYGHITLALHGDTYPLLNYVLYIPGALWLPVSNVFSDLTGSLAVAMAASLLAGAALYRVAGSRGLAADGGEQRVERQLRTTLAWFAFPPVLLAASGGSNDLLLAACLAWMLALRTRAATSLLLLAAGAWIKLVPLVLVAIWVPYRRRELARAWIAPVALSAALAGVLVALGGPSAIAAMVRAMSFQFQRGSFYAPWYTFGLGWLQPFAQAAVIAALLAAVLRLRADSSARVDLVRMSALAGALLLGVQLAANYWTWSYLPWVLPFLLVALLTAERAQAASSGELGNGGLQIPLRHLAADANGAGSVEQHERGRAGEALLVVSDGRHDGVEGGALEGHGEPAGEQQLEHLGA
jgi:glycosyl transferase family 87